MRLRQLNEGFRYGAKQKNEVLNDLDSFGFGIEIEMNPPEDLSYYDGDGDPELLLDHIVDNPAIDIKKDDSGYLASAVMSHISSQHDLFGEDHGGSSLYTSWNLYNILSSMRDDGSNQTDMFEKEKVHGTAYEFMEYLSKSEGDVDINLDEIKQIASDANRYIIPSISVFSVMSLLAENFDVDDLDIGYDYDDTAKIVDNFKDIIRTGIKMLDSFPQSFFEMEDVSDISYFTEEMSNDIKEWANSVYVGDYITAINNFRNSLPSDVDSSTELSNHPTPEKFNNEDILEEIIDSMIDDGKDLEDIIGELGLDVNSESFTSIVESFLSYSPEIPQEILDEVNPYGDLSDFDAVLERVVDTESITIGFHTVNEADGQIEVVTDGYGVSGKDIITAFNESFRIMSGLSDMGFYTADNSGLHISISYKEGEMEFDPIMFAIISNMYRAVKGSSEHTRRYVEDIYTYLGDNIEEISEFIVDRAKDTDSRNLGEVIPEYVRQYLDDSNFDRGRYGDAKFKSANFNHYYSSYGRVELRYFGGEDYESRKDEYFDEVIRAMYALKMSMVDPKTGKGFAHKEYLHTLYRMINKLFKERYDIGVSSYLDMVLILKKAEQLTGKDLLDYSGRDLMEAFRSHYDQLKAILGEDSKDFEIIKKFLDDNIGKPNHKVFKSPMFPKALRVFVKAFR